MVTTSNVFLFLMEFIWFFSFRALILALALSCGFSSCELLFSSSLSNYSCISCMPHSLICLYIISFVDLADLLFIPQLGVSFQLCYDHLDYGSYLDHYPVEALFQGLDSRHEVR